MRPFKLPIFVALPFRLYCVGLVILFLLRFVLLVYTYDNADGFFSKNVLTTFWIGVKFDTSILLSILVIPFVILYLQDLFGVSKFLNVFVRIFTAFLLAVLIFTGVADIPYFKFFNNRLTEASLQWLENTDVVLKMVILNWVNLLFLLGAFSFSIWSYVFFSKTCKKQLEKNPPTKSWPKNLTLFFVASILIFFGIRGVSEQPLRPGDAFHCNNGTLNQIGLNPGYTFVRSIFSRVHLMKEDESLKATKEILRFTEALDSISPIARKVNADTSMSKHNIVLVLMESMSADYMGVFGNEKKFTPNLDSLSKGAWLFTNAYSSGIHTNNGIFSSLYSFPAQKRIRPMSSVPLLKYTGLPYTLKKNGYHTMFFCPHSKSFDNIGVFIPLNYFDVLYSDENYAPEKSIGPFGIPDEDLFQFASDKMNSEKSSEPFFATILTASNHEPYTIPGKYNCNFTKLSDRSVSYADWCIGNFIRSVRDKPWFDNTIFVFVADHGFNFGSNTYDIPLSYNHIPIMFYAPKILMEPKQIPNYMGQIDIFPTLMGLMNVSYVNNTLGTDILKQPRDCMYFSCDDKIGCADSNWLYVYRFGSGESLYHYKTKDPSDQKDQHKDVFEKLRRTALSQIQMAESIINDHQTGIK